MGICFTAADDEKLARGWPYLVVPVDGDKADKTSAAAVKAWCCVDPIYFTEWPRKTLYRFMHTAIETVFVEPANMTATAAKRRDAALEIGDAPSAEESLLALRKLFREGYDTYRFKERDFVWAVEVIAGTDPTLTAIADEVERFEIPKRNDGLNPSCRAAILQAAAFLLLRASPKAAKAARERMARAYDALPPAKTATVYEDYRDTLDYVLHGAAGVKRRAGAWTGLQLNAGVYASLDFAGDDPGYVRDAITTALKSKKLDKRMSVRVAALAGSVALALLPTRKWPAAQMPSVVRDFGMLKAPEIVPFMLSLVGKSSVKDAPMKWFQAHADFARPVLEKTKLDAAKLVLRQLS